MDVCERRVLSEAPARGSVHRSDIASILVRPGLSIKLKILNLTLNNHSAMDYNVTASS